MTPFGLAVRRLRQERGITQKQMAAALGVTSAYLSALENGRKGRPSFEFLQRVAGYFNIIWDDADELLRIARISHPRVVVDTSGLPPDYTAFANRLAAEIRTLSPQVVKDLAEILARATFVREKAR
jgi:transcriptional regulator with XRE-family HTH domain